MASNFPALIAFAATLLAVLQALWVAAQRKHSLPRWSFLLGMLALAAEALLSGMAALADDPAGILRWQAPRLLALGGAVVPWVVFSFTYARGHRPAWSRGLLVAALALWLSPLLLGWVYRADLVVAIRPSALAFRPILTLGWPGFALHLFMLIGSVVVLVNLERTYRAAIGTVRWRIKYALLGVGLLFVVRLFTSSHSLLFRSIDPTIELTYAGGLLAACLLILRSLVRTGHFEMDVYPSPAVLRGSVTLVLAGIYLVVVGLLWKSTFIEGPGAFGLKALLLLLALAGLAGALQSDRAQLVLRRFVSRHFQRPFYDYRDAWRSFTEGTATKLDQHDLCQAIVRLASNLFQAKSVSVWLTRDDAGTLTCAASTALTVSGSTGRNPTEAESAMLQAHFLSRPEPVEIEDEPAPWAGVLREMHPRLFKKGGNRAAAPLISHGAFVGLLVVGDRVSGGAFGAQDLDMLRCGADHAASNLLNVQLTARSLQHRELAAFQTMATFFVHDLKNAASTLNLMLPNLPVHWNNADFREDALRGISKTVGHINTLVRRLGEVRKELAPEPKAADLNELVEKTLAGWQAVPHLNLTQTLNPTPPVCIDEDQIRTVVSNLLLNAREAIDPSPERRGEIQLSTSARGTWAVLRVSDNGCGMPQAFVDHSLFKPFQTTKKDGLGIGMFQSKMIVEAHGGRLTVSSVPGRGTTFEITLPSNPALSVRSPAASSPTHEIR